MSKGTEKTRVVKSKKWLSTSLASLVFFSRFNLSCSSPMRRPRESRIALLAVVALLAVTGHRISSKRRR